MTVTGVTKIRNVGIDSVSYNIVFVAEGFTSAEQPVFQSAATLFLNDLFSFEPFATEVSGSINVHRLDVESVDSGTTLTCGGGAGNTDFLAEVCSSGLDRLITVDNALLFAAADTWVANWDVLVVVVNNSAYGGSGSTDVAVYSTGTSTTVPIHELGHAGFGLADEYEYWAGCTSGETTQDNYSSGEPSEPNVTIDTNRATIKWGNLVDAATALPTTSNVDCSQCDPQLSPVAAGTVGAFEGGRYHHCGVYRPEFNCMMRVNGVALCAVCQEHIATQVLLDASPCFVATAVYRDAHHPDVETIRRWRDHHLRPGAPMRPAMASFTAFYNRVGPPLASWVKQRPAIAARIRRWMLTPLARFLRTDARDN